MPPAVAAANDTTSTPKRSRRCRTPTIAPLKANTKVPKRSSARTNVSTVTATAAPARARWLGARLLARPALRDRQHDRDDRHHDHQEIRDKGEECRFAHRDVV